MPIGAPWQTFPAALVTTLPFKLESAVDKARFPALHREAGPRLCSVAGTDLYRRSGTSDGSCAA